MNERLYWADVMHPDDVGWVGETVERAVATQEPFEMVYRIRHPAGPERWVLDRGRGCTRRRARPSRSRDSWVT